MSANPRRPQAFVIDDEPETKSRHTPTIDFATDEPEVAEIVVGHPLRMSGEASAQTDKVLAFVEELRQEFPGPIHLWDERLTSVQANRIINESGRTRMERKGVVDRMAAVLILQAWAQFLICYFHQFALWCLVWGLQFC